MGGGGTSGRRDALRSADAFKPVRDAALAAAAGARGRERLPPRHCWVENPPAAPGRWPGVVVEWRTAEAGWQARVVVVIGRGRAAAVLDVWLDESHLSPA